MSQLSKEEIESFVKEYKQLKKSYVQLVEIVKDQLEKILKKSNIKYLLVQGRTKTKKSLKQKLQDSNKPAPKYSVSELSDLAGCRVILYHEYEINNLISRISEVFQIHKREQKYSRNDYTAHHVDVLFENHNLLFPNQPMEHKSKCEIQITTALHHIWSESAHDLLYKTPKEISQHTEADFNNIKRGMAKRAEETTSIQLRLNEIFEGWNKLQRAIKKTSIANLKLTSQLNNNDLIYEELCGLSNCISEFENLCSQENYVSHLKKIIKKSKHNVRDSSLNTFNSHIKNKKIYIEILGFILKQKKDIGKVIDELISLTQDDNTEIVKRSIQTLANSLTYKVNADGEIINIDTFNYVMKRTSSIPKKDITKYYPLIINICCQILAADAELIDDKAPDQITHRKISSVRNKSIDTLVGSFQYINSNTQKIDILNSLSLNNILNGNVLSFMDKEKIIVEDIKIILEFYLEVIDSDDYIFLLLINDRVNAIQHYNPNANSDLIKKIYSSLQNSTQYHIYKTLFADSITDYKESDMSITEKKNQKELMKLVENISRDNLDIYIQVLNYIAGQYTFIYESSDIFITYQYFYKFIGEIGSNKPDIIRNLIDQDQNYQLKPFYPEILRAVWKNDQKEYVNDLTDEWISNGKNLTQCIEFLRLINNMNKNNISQIYQSAVNNNDLPAVYDLLYSIVRTYKGDQALRLIAVDCMKYLADRKYHFWLNVIDFYCILNQSFLDDLQESDWLDILDVFLLPSDLERLYSKHSGTMYSLSQKFPALFIRVLMQRADYKHLLISQNNLQDYKAIPQGLKNFSIDSQNSKVIVNEFFQIMKKQPIETTKYVEVLVFLFPNFNKYLENTLIESIDSKKNVDFIIELISEYNGSQITHKLCKYLIGAYPESRQLEDKLIRALSGKYFRGRGSRVIVDSHRERINQVEKWRVNDDEAVRKFADTFIKFQKSLLPAEEQRADQWEQHLNNKPSSQPDLGGN